MYQVDSSLIRALILYIDECISYESNIAIPPHRVDGLVEKPPSDWLAPSANQDGDVIVSYAMKPERLTHARRREQTRERLFDAARTIFLEKGVAATSVEDIVEAAGYTRGAFYSNFCGKQELLTELLRRDRDEARAKLQAIVEDRGTPEEAQARAIAYYSRDYVESDSFPLWVEAQLLARRDNAFGERVRAFRREKLLQVGAHIRTLVADGDRGLSVDVDTFALGLVSLCDGVQFLRMCNPQTATDQAIQSVLAQFLSWVLSRQAGEIRVEEHPASATASCT
jgi:AcrR family transcriptional regulator